MNPEILTHPHIPPPLQDVNPRTIMGTEWWNIQRQVAYKSENYHCSACGVHKSQARKHQWLEAHEYYKFDYYEGFLEFVKLVPLCHYCHNFIHSGRLSMIENKEKPTAEIKEILEHGFNILSLHQLECFWFTLDYAQKLGVDTKKVQKYKISGRNISWNEWYLLFNGQKYYSKFKNQTEWENFYKGK